MKIAFGFYGILYGYGGRTGSTRNFRHCWPNINRMIIQPFVEKGYDAEIYVSSYPFDDKSIENEFYQMVKPKKVYYSDLNGSDAFTSKYALFNLLKNANGDAVIFTRLDAHWSRKVANENIDLTKFNFLFPEKGWWQTQYRFTCDNFYAWPHYMTPAVKKAMEETYAFPRGKPLVDTHGLLLKLQQYVSLNEMHMISAHEELSDVNSFYTCCRSGLPNRDCMHEEVRDRYNTENWSYHT